MFRCIRRFGVSHGSRVEPGLTPKRLMGLDAMNYPHLLSMSEITQGIVFASELDASFQQERVGRDVVRWIGEDVIEIDGNTGSLAALAALPCSSVLSESSSSQFSQELAKRKDDPKLSKHRGFLDLIAVAPTGIAFPARTLVVNDARALLQQWVVKEGTTQMERRDHPNFSGADLQIYLDFTPLCDFRFSDPVFPRRPCSIP